MPADMPVTSSSLEKYFVEVARDHLSKQYLADNPKVLAEIEKKVREKVASEVV